MEAHNFSEGEKVRLFCVTLIGEARLWYESLALCARAQLISQHVDAGQLNIPPQQ